MFDYNSKYIDIYNDQILGKYATHLASFAKKESKIVSNDLNPWPEKESIDCLNFISILSSENKLVYKEFNKDSSFLLLKQSKPSKLAIVVAGGGYGCVCTLPEALPVAVALYKQGFSALTFDYGVKDKAIYALNDLSTLISFLEKNERELNIVISDYMVIGFSAGAHLVGSLGSSNLGYVQSGLPKPGLLVLSYPVITMLEPHCHIGTRNNLLGLSPTLEEKEKYSLELHVDNDYPNTFIWVCKDDNVVDSSNSCLMDEALKKNNVIHDFVVYPSNVHGFGIARNTVASSWMERMLGFYFDKCRK